MAFPLLPQTFAHGLDAMAAPGQHVAGFHAHDGAP
jgi:hypothetical protein